MNCGGMPFDKWQNKYAAAVALRERKAAEPHLKHLYLGLVFGFHERTVSRILANKIYLPRPCQGNNGAVRHNLKGSA